MTAAVEDEDDEGTDLGCGSGGGPMDPGRGCCCGPLPGTGGSGRPPSSKTPLDRAELAGDECGELPRPRTRRRRLALLPRSEGWW